MTPFGDLFGEFYNPLHLLSYGKRWMISTGSRSIGKSTGWGMFLLYDYLKRGHKFIYLRRTKDEAAMTAGSCFDSSWYIMRDNGYPIYSIVAKAGKFWLKRTADGEAEECGSYIGLSEAYKYKSANFGDNGYRNILYDEFITTDPTKYLGTQKDFTREFVKCDELYITVDRSIGKPSLGETNFIFLANLSTYYNPIFVGLGIDTMLTPDTKILNPKGTKWILEQTKSVKATEEREKTESRITTTEEMLNRYNNSNAAFYDNYNLVQKMTKPMTAICNIKYKDHIMGVYQIQGNDDICYISNQVNTLKVIALTPGDLGKPDYSLPRSPEGYYYFSYISDHFTNGRCRFANRQCQRDIQTYMLCMPMN